MCAALSSAGYEIHLFAVSEQTKPYLVRGVMVHPLPVSASRRQRFGRRSRVAEMAASLKPDLFHVHEPELLGSTIAHAGSRPVVYDVHESYLDILMEREWIPSMIRPVARLAWDKWERRLIPHCAAIVTATNHITERYRSLHPRVVAIRNFTDVSIQLSESEVAKRDGFTCVFAGTILPNRNLANTLRALGILRRRGVGARLWVAGKWLSESYKREILALAHDEDVDEQMQYFGVLPRREAIVLQAAASIGLVNLLPTPNVVHSLPIRMLEYMVLGLPLVYSDFPGFKEIAGSCGAGIAVDPGNPEQTADAMESLIRNPDVARQMGQAGMRAVREQYSWQTERNKLFNLYESILAPTTKAGSNGCIKWQDSTNTYITEQVTAGREV
jgi:glycosyltransferase involved in cell wall biosynthesis